MTVYDCTTCIGNILIVLIEGLCTSSLAHSHYLHGVRLRAHSVINDISLSVLLLKNSTFTCVWQISLYSILIIGTTQVIYTSISHIVLKAFTQTPCWLM